MEDSLANKNEKKLELLPEGISYLDEARKWSMFLAIMGFIGVGFLLIAVLFMGAIFSFIPDTDLPGWLGLIFSVLYLIIAVLYFFPVYYLFQFSQNSRKAVKEGSSNFFTEAIGKLKLHYKFIGIMTIVMLVVYPVFLIVIVMLGVFSAL